MEQGRTPVIVQLDIVIPVYNEGRNIVSVLAALAREVRTPARVLICYDMPDDDTLPAVRNNPEAYAGLAVELVRNSGRGAHQAVMTGFAASTAPFVLMYAADDDYNAAILDRMVALAKDGCDIVCASRFMPGGGMVGCPWLKGVLLRSANFTLYHVARLPTQDASVGFRLFSRRVIEQIALESDRGFCYSIELLVKCHRLGWKIGEVPAWWFERKHGESRFRVLRWVPAYLRWYGYAYATTFLRRPASTVPMKVPAQPGSRTAPPN
jgi:dolichol-phosphate mannosyltransferase